MKRKLLTADEEMRIVHLAINTSACLSEILWDYNQFQDREDYINEETVWNILEKYNVI